MFCNLHIFSNRSALEFSKAIEESRDMKEMLDKVDRMVLGSPEKGKLIPPIQNRGHKAYFIILHFKARQCASLKAVQSLFTELQIEIDLSFLLLSIIL